MAMAVNFRWKTPTITAQKNAMQQNGWSQGLSDVADSIKYAKESRYRKEQDALNREAANRREQREIEDRKRRMDWEDKQRSAWKESADVMRGAISDRAALEKRAGEIRARISEIEAQLREIG